jgi:UDP-glucuronate 4-epimerase
VKILITGAAGFIGFHLSRRLLNEGHEVVGLDNLNAYYPVKLKRDRLAQLQDSDVFTFVEAGLEDAAAVAAVFEAHTFTHVVNLAAQAGVRYSLESPETYVQSNLVGFLHILEGCRHHKVQHLVFASSSSVYGLNTTIPLSTSQNVDHPISLYAATKKSNELMAHTYAHLFGIRATGLRFFSVYGPWGRPDMVSNLFTDAILADKPIDVFNHGKMRRSFTYVDDIVEGITRVMQRVPEPDPTWSGDSPNPSSSSAPYKLYNIGNQTSVELQHFISVLEGILGKKAKKNYMPIQPGDVPDNQADVKDLEADVGFRPSVSLEVGLKRFMEWYSEYYGRGQKAEGRG